MADSGKTWRAVAKDPRQLAALANESAFAASGTCLSVRGKNDVWFVTGGAEVTRVFHSPDRGQTWSHSATQIPAGFLSVVTTVPGTSQVWLAGGLTGSGVSVDGGKTWQVLGSTPLNALSLANQNSGWAIGPKGLLMKYVGKKLQ